MFGLKKSGLNNPQDKNSTSDKKMGFDQQKDSQIENLPIQNMKNDLKNINNPKYSVKTSADTPTSLPKTKAAKSVKSSVPQKTSPFLNPSKEKKAKILSVENSQKKHPGIGQAILIAIVLFILLIAGGGGYYFWMTRMAEEPPVTPPVTPIEPTPEPPIVPEPTFSKTNPNYLNIDIENSDTQMIKTTLSDNAEKVMATGEIAAFEFLITDNNNNPISFQDFSQKLGLTLPQNILSNLGSNFSFFIYNYGNKSRFGLSIDSLDDAELESNFLAEEKNLMTELEPLYNDNSFIYTNTNATFLDNTYQDASIRYINIPSPEDLSVDYSIYNGRLIIATTRTAMYSILDKLSASPPPLILEK